MKFITEMELRDLYKIEPFATYVLEPGTKITPEARQFLMDRRVTLIQGGNSEQVIVQEHSSTLRLRRKMDTIESQFFLTSTEILQSGDTALAEEVLLLGKSFNNVRKAEQKQIAPEKIVFWGWSEEEILQNSNGLEEYEITQFHLGLKNGREIALLNHLRASLQEVELEIMETYWNRERQLCSRQDLINSVNLIITILCMMMQKYLGGKKCKL